MTEEHRDILTIRNRKGIHARAAAKFVKTVETFDAQVKVRKVTNKLGHEEHMPAISGSSILALMMLGAECGATIEVVTQGRQALEAMQNVRDLINGKFGEGE
jgi:phosphocarrier protein